MRNPRRKIAFVLVASDHGTMIVNRLDYRMLDQRSGIGIGFQILENASCDLSEVDNALGLLALRRRVKPPTAATAAPAARRISPVFPATPPRRH